MRNSYDTILASYGRQMLLINDIIPADPTAVHTSVCQDHQRLTNISSIFSSNAAEVLQDNEVNYDCAIIINLQKI